MPPQALDDDPAGAEGADESAVDLRELQVQANAAGERLDKWLVGTLAEFSRSYLQQAIHEGHVQVAGKVVTKAATKVQALQAVQVRLYPTAEATAFAPQPVPVDTLWADAHIRILSKPPGLVVHPAPGHWSGTLLNGLLHLDPASAQVPRAGIVHRLDKDTSGLMVAARSRTSMDALVRAIAARDVSRIYVALVHGRWPLPVGQWRSVTAAIGRDPSHRQRMAVVDLSTQPGKEAATDFCLLASGSHDGVPLSWLCCRLHTGRTHQIRVHAAHLGHALVSDPVYGGRPAAGISRQALHAARLALSHPITGEALEHWAALPADLRGALSASGIEAPGPLGYNLRPFID